MVLWVSLVIKFTILSQLSICVICCLSVFVVWCFALCCAVLRTAWCCVAVPEVREWGKMQDAELERRRAAVQQTLIEEARRRFER